MPSPREIGWRLDHGAPGRLGQATICVPMRALTPTGAGLLLVTTSRPD